MRHALPFLALGLAFTTGCIVVTDNDDHQGPPPPPVNVAPYVSDAEAGVYWDQRYHDDIWYFDAYVEDGDGPYDVTEVWADVYDDYAPPGAQDDGYIESFELYPTNDPNVWFSDWLGSSTWLDPYYTGYSVDIVAYDTYGETSVITVWPYTY